MQMRRRGYGEGMNAKIDQVVHVGHGRATQGAPDEFGLLAIRIGHADQLDPRHFGKHTGMVTAHDADAYDTNAQHTPRALLRGMQHYPIYPLPDLITQTVLP